MRQPPRGRNCSASSIGQVTELTLERWIRLVAARREAPKQQCEAGQLLPESIVQVRANPHSFPVRDCSDEFSKLALLGDVLRHSDHRRVPTAGLREPANLPRPDTPTLASHNLDLEIVRGPVVQGFGERLADDCTTGLRISVP